MVLRVIDVGTQVAGPFVATILGDLGADVVKCEQPGAGDPLRLPGGMSPRWQADGRNKRSCTLNLRLPKGQALLKRLAGWADVLVENFRPGTMARWGLSYDDVRAVNPRLVYVSVSGFGQSGPDAARPAYHSIGAAFGGITNLTGVAGGPPVTPGPFLTDYIGGLFGVIGALEALRRRDEPGGTGDGEWVDCALYESAMRLCAPEFAEYCLTGVARERNDAPPMATGDGRYVTILAVQPEQYRKLVDLVGDPELDDERFATAHGRALHRRDFDRIIADWVARHDAAEIVARLVDAGVPASQVNTVADLAQHPHVEARRALAAATNHEGRELRMPGVMPHLVHRPGAVRWLGEPLGASNDYVYRELLGLSDDEVAQLRDEGVV